MKIIFAKIAVLLALLPALAHAGGDEVIVIYNSRVPESKAVAEHYAQLRQVPDSQMFSFALKTNEVMSRADFTDYLQKPLVKKLEDTGLWKFGKVTIPATNGVKEHKEIRVVESKIRYAVLCYGMPLKIDAAPLNESISEKSVAPELRNNGAAVDSELACLPLLKESPPLTGPMQNPIYLSTNMAGLGCRSGVLLIARLDGPTAEIASNLVDKAIAAERDGLWGRGYFDSRGLATNDSYYIGDNWMVASALISRAAGFSTELDTNPETFRNWMPMSHIALYAGWYDAAVSGPFALPHVEFMPGAFAYHLHSGSADTVRSAELNWCGPLLAKGATCTMGCVYEPFLPFTPNVAFFLQQFLSGATFGEAAWAAQPGLSWMTTVIGDPLYRPMNRPPQRRHAELEHEKNPLIEWSFERLINLDLARGLRAPQLANFLEKVPQTKTSAVLAEKLAELYDAQGKPSSAIAAWQQAIKLNPSRGQHIRLHNILAEKLAAAGRDEEAAANWREYLAEFPDDPNAFATRERLNMLEQKIAAQKK